MSPSQATSPNDEEVRSSETPNGNLETEYARNIAEFRKKYKDHETTSTGRIITISPCCPNRITKK